MENNNNVENTENVNVENNSADTKQKTYTEQDIQNSFNAGVRKASSEWQKDEKYKEFLDWKNKNQNDTEKLAELQSNNENLTNELKNLKAQMEVSKSNVKKEFVKFVTSEVMSMTNDSVDFESALENYKKDNPQYFSEVVVKKQTSPHMNGGNKQKTTNDIMNTLLRNR